jgi:hypothetical protein
MYYCNKMVLWIQLRQIIKFTWQFSFLAWVIWDFLLQILFRKPWALYWLCPVSLATIPLAGWSGRPRGSTTLAGGTVIHTALAVSFCGLSTGLHSIQYETALRLPCSDIYRTCVTNTESDDRKIGVGEMTAWESGKVQEQIKRKERKDERKKEWHR